MRGLIVGGTRSGSGKTTLTLGLLAAFRRQGRSVQACKIGPDFIDPSLHTALTGLPSYNIDTWMGRVDGTRRVYARIQGTASADMLIIEGVMGLFDGAGGADPLCSPGSTAHTAATLQLPVVLVADAHGMGQSAAVSVAGFVRARTDITFAGIVYSHTGGTHHADILREAHTALVSPTEAPLLGILPREGAPHLASRHLGLLLGHEHDWNTNTGDALAHWCEQHIDMDTLYARCVPIQTMLHALPPIPVPHRRIGVARDAAFCFCYPDMPLVFAEMGAEVVYFSPLADTHLPKNCHALYFPGGYPELHASTLAANTPLREAIRTFASQGGHIYGECGGYMYLMRSLHTDGVSYPMCGCLPLECRMEQTRSALGYREVTLANTDVVARGHEFHYARLDSEYGEHTLSPLWRVRDRLGRSLPDAGVRCGSVAASWVHLYPEGARDALPYLFPGLHHA